MSRDNVLEVHNVSKRFGGLLAVDNVSFEVKKGDIVAIIGPNGAGKTTLLNLISGLLKPDSGRIIFCGKDVTYLRPYQRARLGIARTFQIPIYLRDLYVIENIYASILWKEKDHKRAIKKSENMLKLLGLSDFWKKGEELTLIEEKKLEIARALAQDPVLILMDEPAAGLRPEEMIELKKIITNLVAENKITVIVVEHVLKFIMDISDHVIVLSYGKKIAEGKPVEVMKKEEVIRAYLGVSEVF